MLTPFSPAALEAEGFAGFISIGQLHRSGCLEVPDEPGVYAVVLRDEAPHGFLVRSTAPPWRRREPSVSVDELAAHWVEGARLLYVGRAPGPGVRSRLRQRIKRFLRYGHGSVVAHWDGRFVWQLRESSRLAVAWRTCREAGEAAKLADELLTRFEQHHGSPPFANLRGEPSTDEEARADGGS